MRRKKNTTSFEVLAKLIHVYLKEEGFGGLNFRGYKETLSLYSHIDDVHLPEIYDLTTDCLLWNHYFIDLEALMELKYEEWLLEADRLKALEERANPDRILDEAIKKATERAKHYKLFVKHCKSQRIFFQKAYEHCLDMYKQGLKGFARTM